MKGNKIMKLQKQIISAVFAVLLISSSAAGLSLSAGTETEPGLETGIDPGAVAAVPENMPQFYAPRPLQEGDTPAIQKITVKAPSGFEGRESDNAMGFRDGKATIEINAMNYREDYVELPQLAEDFSTMYSISRIMSMEDVYFNPKPVKTAVSGFSALMYEYNTTQNGWVTDENGVALKDENGRDIRTPIDYYKGRFYYFFSNEDVYLIHVETNLSDWKEYLPKFNKFVRSVRVDGAVVGFKDRVEYATGLGFVTVVIIAAAAAALIAGVIVFVLRKKKRRRKQ